MGTIETRWAGRATRWLSGAGPVVAHAEAKACTQQLHSQAARAPRIVAGITGMGPQVESLASTPVYVLDRASWAKVAAQGIVSMFDEASDAVQEVSDAEVSHTLQGMYGPCDEGQDKHQNAQRSILGIGAVHAGNSGDSHGFVGGLCGLIKGMRGKVLEAVDAAQLATAMALLAPRVLGHFTVVPQAYPRFIGARSSSDESELLQAGAEVRASRAATEIWTSQADTAPFSFRYSHGPFTQTNADIVSSRPQRQAKILLVAPNILAFGTRWSLDKRDLALGVAIHEFTHALQYEAAPWLHDYILTRVSYALTADSIGRWWEHVGEEILAVMSLVEGHATAVVREVPRSLMPSRDRLMQALRHGPSRNVLMEFMNFADITGKMEQYSRGEAFVREVIDSCGHEGLNKVWEAPRNIPTLAELASPQTWMRRVL